MPELCFLIFPKFQTFQTLGPCNLLDFRVYILRLQVHMYSKREMKHDLIVTAPAIFMRNKSWELLLFSALSESSPEGEATKATSSCKVSLYPAKITISSVLIIISNFDTLKKYSLGILSYFHLTIGKITVKLKETWK